jgi:CysZ protein
LFNVVRGASDPEKGAGVLRVGQRFSAGFLLALTGGQFLLHHRRLWALALAPLLLNILLYLAALLLIAHYYEQGFGLLLAPPQSWYLLIGYYALRLLALLMISALFLFSFVFVGTGLAAPFLERLSARVEGLLGGRTEEARVTFPQLLADCGRAVGHSFLCLSLLIAAAPLNFLPGLGHAAWLLLSWLLLAYNFTTFAMDRRRLSFGAKWRWLLAEGAATLGLGAALFVMMAVPVVGFVLLPVATVAGTMLLRDIEGRRSP